MKLIKLFIDNIKFRYLMYKKRNEFIFPQHHEILAVLVDNMKDKNESK